MMLHHANRLRRPTDVRRVRQLGRRWRHPLVILLVQPNDLPQSRFAFVASRRVGKAVKRNRVKRLMREVIRRHLPAISQGYDCVWIARAALADANFAEAETAVLQLLRRAKLFPMSGPKKDKE